MPETLIQQMIRIAKEHGFRAEESLSGGVDIHIPFTKDGRSDGVKIETVHSLRQLRDALGY